MSKQHNLSSFPTSKITLPLYIYIYIKSAGCLTNLNNKFSFKYWLKSYTIFNSSLHGETLSKQKKCGLP